MAASEGAPHPDVPQITDKDVQGVAANGAPVLGAMTAAVTQVQLACVEAGLPKGAALTGMLGYCYECLRKSGWSQAELEDVVRQLERMMKRVDSGELSLEVGGGESN